MSDQKPITYISYLRIDELLTLQSPESEPEEHDEMLFIVIHQVYELWFKQILHEVDHLCALLRDTNAPSALHTLNRMLTIFKTVVAQIDVLETMTPMEFNSFRSFLASSSGFQSIQFRELEFALGYKRLNMLNHFPEETFHYAKLKQRFESPSLWDAFLHFLSANGADIPQDLLERDVTGAIEASEGLQAGLIDVYRNNHELMQVCERLVDFDEGFQEWRYRHMRMVQRTIGSKPGTGGSPGVAYLSSTIKSLYPDLWAIRSEL